VYLMGHTEGEFVMTSIEHLSNFILLEYLFTTIFSKLLDCHVSASHRESRVSLLFHEEKSTV